MSKMKFTKKVKDNWINAMKSGDYKQGDGVFYHNGAYCSLGVLLDSIPGFESIENDKVESNGCVLDGYDILESLIGMDNVEAVYSANDEACYEGQGDNYADAIKVAESLATEEEHEFKSDLTAELSKEADENSKERAEEVKVVTQ